MKRICVVPQLSRQDTLFLAGLLLLTILFHFSLFLFSELSLDEDSLLFFYPLRSLHDDPHTGFWDGYMFSGFPREANPQSQLFYPPNLIFAFFHTAQGMSLLIVGHLFLGAASMYLLLRGLRLTSHAALLGALAFLLSTFWRCKIVNLGLLEGVAWVPALIYFYLLALEYRHYAFVILSVFMLSLIILAGVPHTVVYSGMFLLILTLVYLFSRVQSVIYCLFTFAQVILLSLLLTTCTWLPALLYMPYTVRNEMSLDEALAGSISWLEMWKVFLGGLEQPEISRCDPWEGTCYVGISALLFLPFSYRLMPGRLCYALGISFLFALLCTAGMQGGMYPLLYQVLPGWDLMNLPNRSLLIAAVVLPVFCAFGFESWLQAGYQKWRTVLFLVLAGFCAGAFITFALQNPWTWTTLIYPGMTSTFHPESVSATQWAVNNFLFWSFFSLVLMALHSMKRLRFEVGFVLLCILLIAQSAQYTQRLFLQTTPATWYAMPRTAQVVQERLEDQFGRVCGYAPLIDADSDVRMEYIKPVLMHRLPEVYRFSEIQGYDPMIPRAYAELLRAWGGQSAAVDPLRKLRLANLPGKMLDFLGVRYVVGYPNQEVLFVGAFHLMEPDIIQSPLKQPKEVEAVSIRWVSVGTFHVPQAAQVGRVLVLNGTETVQEFPVRMGIEIANQVLGDPLQIVPTREDIARHRAADIYRWFPIPSERGYMNVYQYIARFTLSTPSVIDTVAIEWLLPNATLSVREIDLYTSDFQGLTLVSSDAELPVYENPDALPPAYLVHHVQHYTLVDEMIEFLNQRREEDELPVFLPNNHPSPIDSSPIIRDRSSQDELIYQRPHSDEIRLQVETQVDGLVAIQENYAPAWTATLNGTPVEILQANHAFMAIAVPAGKHEIVIRYVPRMFYIGCSISGSILVILLISLGFTGRTALSESGWTG
jgi:hypothetical protein